MSRVDVPTLRCDRCGFTTQDKWEMGRFSTLEHPNGPGHQTEKWDVCPTCWKSFRQWLVALDGETSTWVDTERVVRDLDAADPLRRALEPGTDEHEAMVERLAEAFFSETGLDPFDKWDQATIARYADAVVRVLAGETGEGADCG